MRYLPLLPALAGLASADPELSRRASPNAPNGYTPTAVDCPANRPSVRSAGTGLSSSESAWLKTRRNVTLQAMPNFLNSLNISGFDAQQYAQTHFGNSSNAPNIGLAFSGGGLRATLTGAGAIQAFDSRESNITPNLGGLLDSATYLAGLSGGGWLVGSIYVNNYSTISSFINGGAGASNDLWNFSNALLSGPDPSAIGISEYYSTLHKEVEGKSDAGYDITFTDYWGQAIAFQFINATDGGPAYTWSSIRNDSLFSQGKTPFPFLAADNKPNDQLTLYPTNSTVYEFNPYEMGTWDPTGYGFVDVEFLGSNFSNGSLAADAKCVRGYDNAGFALGTTSSIVSSLISGALTSEIPASVQSLLGNLVNETQAEGGLVTMYQPNPFNQWDITGQAQDVDQETLVLVDGGTDLQNIPFQPLIQPVRDVDVIVAVDSSNDINGWPNGTAIVSTYERQLNSSGIGNHTAFPAIPDQNTFINLGLNQRPTFFGCNASNTSSPAPLIVYIPNAPYVTYSNISTYQLTVNTTQRNALIANGNQVATLGNGTTSAQFRSCLGCALLSRSFDRTNTTVPAACTTCFQDFCWNGTVNSTTPATYNPTLGTLGKSQVNATSNGSDGNGTASSNQVNAATRMSQVGMGLSLSMAVAAFFL